MRVFSLCERPTKRMKHAMMTPISIALTNNAMA
jgi:hypothetical protein